MINTEKIFEKLIPLYCKKFKISKVTLKRDNRIWGSAFVNWKNNKNIITYSSKHLDSYGSYDWVLSTLFHELGHLKYKLPYKTKKEKIFSEYKAELFGVKQLKKYYPIKSKKHILFMIKYALPLWEKKHSIHYQACIKIKEYQSKGVKNGKKN